MRVMTFGPHGVLAQKDKVHCPGHTLHIGRHAGAQCRTGDAFQFQGQAEPTTVAR